ncbi:hemerythrin domain-containing protein [Geodermatophilus sp. FMUSA9-8]|uniref:hemerythrin domain-containing protein n=1 Tax=Geodermatophilus sp. FMUSA9-8 TaxID=3120155 RepID=UPI003009596B
MTTTTHPVQIRLEGQAAAPDGPIDLVGMFVMHRGFRRDLEAFAAVVPAVPVADRARWRRLSRRFARFARYLHAHHSGEDAGLWPLLAERGADPAVLDALEAEHAGIDPALAAVAAGLRELAAGRGDAATRAELAAQAVALRDGLAAHLAHEESDGMEQVQRHLTPEDWERLEREVFSKEYRPHEMLGALGWTVSAIPDDVVGRLPVPHPAMLAVARFLGRRAARADARAFGTAR